MSRGDHQELIYRNDKDRIRFLETLGECCEKTGWLVHAYVLKGNHYHLLLETPEANLVTGMKWFQGVYTPRFNARHRLFGHLFQGRYETLVVDPEDEYFATVGSYIHLNPERANLVHPVFGGLAKYRWSSFPENLKPRRKRPKWLVTEDLYSIVGIEREDPTGRRRFEAWTDAQAWDCARGNNEQLEQEWKKVRRGWYLGSETFKEKLLSKLEGILEGHQRDSQSGGAKRERGEVAAPQWFRMASEHLKLNGDALAKLKKGDERKLVLAWGLRTQFMVSCKWVTSLLHMGDPSRVSAAVKQVKGVKKGPMAKLRKTLGCVRKPFNTTSHRWRP
ncbi:MAG: transposase, partial [Akkermansiaceae bacterium]